MHAGNIIKEHCQDERRNSGSHSQRWGIYIVSMIKRRKIIEHLKSWILKVWHIKLKENKNLEVIQISQNLEQKDKEKENRWKEKKN